MERAYYSATLAAFRAAASDAILGALTTGAASDGLTVGDAQLAAWRDQIAHLQGLVHGREGAIFLEYSIPRMGRRIDAVVLLGPAIFVIEYKFGENRFERGALDQVWDYALDLKNFHETSHRPCVVPILVSTAAVNPSPQALTFHGNDNLLNPLRANLDTLSALVDRVLAEIRDGPLDQAVWSAGRYRPTPTIIEAALALYTNHSVADIARSDAGAVNLGRTSDTVQNIIQSARREKHKAICFVTGVPGAGKTLVGLNVATQNMDKSGAAYSVYLSGNGPLVKILCEALARDQVERGAAAGKRLRMPLVRSEVKAFIQNVHHFRDECLRDPGPPVEHVAIFDEAQRAWTKQQTSLFMARRKRVKDFDKSEPEFLISCLDRHPDWAVVVCLVGGGQEINTGEAGIGEWLDSLQRSFPNWRLYISPALADDEYGTAPLVQSIANRPHVHHKPELHLSTSMRSFRAENISRLVKQILDLEVDQARQSLGAAPNYPIALTRNLAAAKTWLKDKARGTERFGIVASSQAERLKPHAIAVKSPIDPVHWFLDGKNDTRSSYYLEDVATEFHIQGLELDWACVTWDADLRHNGRTWEHWSFRGDGWRRVRRPERQRYLKNSYRVLLTRARQGMVIFVPEGDSEDPTRAPEFYDSTYKFLQSVGLPTI